MALLCPTDFSDASRHGATAAALLAQRWRVPLLLVHVASPRTQEGHAVRAALRSELARLSALGADVEPLLDSGDAPARQLLARIAERRPTLVVAGATPHEPPRHVRAGTLLRVAQETQAPLLAIRDAAPWEAWLRAERPLRIVLGTDTSPCFRSACGWLPTLTQLGPVDVTAAHVYWPSEAARRLGTPRPRSVTERVPALERALEQEVHRQVGSLEGVPLRIQLLSGLGHLGAHLVLASEEAGADLLVVGSHQRRALGTLVSVSHYALREARLAVASVPVPRAPAAATRGPRWLGAWRAREDSPAPPLH